MAKTELESRIQRRCQQIIKDGGAFVYKTHGNIYTRTGLPDLVACVPVTEEVLRNMLDDNWFKDRKIGIFVSFEIKRENHLDDLSKAQEIVGREIKNAGGIWFSIEDSDIVHGVIKTMEGKI